MSLYKRACALWRNHADRQYRNAKQVVKFHSKTENFGTTSVYGMVYDGDNVLIWGGGRWSRGNPDSKIPSDLILPRKMFDELMSFYLLENNYR